MTASLRGTWKVAELESAKLVGQLRVTLVLTLALVAPFVLVGALAVQASTPTDTLFGRWVHASGLAVPLVVVGFAGQWAFPAMSAIVAGDLFASEDRHQTWKVLLSRSRTRGEVFLGKTIVGLGFALVAATLTIASSVAAGLLVNPHGPLVNLSGSLVQPGPGIRLVLLTGLSQLPPVLGMAGFALLLSVVTRSGSIGLAGPVVVGLVSQLVALMDMPAILRMLTPAGAFSAWRGLWLDQQAYTQIWVGIGASLAALAGSVAVAATVFLRRDVAVR